ncbi:hypothetical protein HS088_TW03G00505 [Tripterygium wilfordii]|uniref:Protein kinase domain-containing protein n=1 Tax=Tripterygium wilfordii TaxID=458696 RepID=A0A7J7DV44_TRIWF|nr:receptor protein kinase-like protein ZAR1 [Tripterygium wilfordii]KAF5750173.1 hypothetical protein HS088_TW03G00505 [Tripterygium wilfordii]
MALHLVFLAFFLCHSSSVLVVSLNDEGFALLSFKEAVGGYQDWSLDNWNSSDANPCSWNGVTCKEEKVISLRIPNKMLSGFLHPALGTLVALRHVNLRNNNLYGGLPSELFNAKGLQSLVLSGNSFSGPVPPEIGTLNYLQILDLSNNSFNGSIPSSLGQCMRLKSLVLSRNTFYGSLPVRFGIDLISLQNLNLSFNILSGSIPSSIGNLSSLQGTLDLSHNSFNGSIPPSLGSLPETLYIDLSYNNLSGSIPVNAVLLNSGPTAFIGNPLLCGTPLKVPCSSSTQDGNDQSLAQDPSLSSGTNSVRSGKGSSYSSVMTITIVFAVAGICLMGLVFTYWYKKVWTCKGLKHGGGGCNCKETLTIKNEISCFRKDYLETLSENPENYGFIPLDSNIDFDLENLLRASAFLLGKSGIGILYRVALANGITVAVRRLGDGGSQRFKEFQTEVEAIGKVRHPNIVSLRAYCWSVDEKLLIYDYIPNGDLATAIHGKAGIVSYKPLPWPVRLRIIKGMAKGLAFLHEFSPKRYIHGSLKPTNVLLRENMEPCISDFGIGQLVNISEEYLTEQTTPVTPQQSSPYHFTTANLSSTRSYYQAPEASKVTKPSQKWDVYSYGVVILELISGKSPMVQMGSLKMDIVRWIQLSIDVGKPLSAVLDPFLTRNLEIENEVFLIIKIALACVHKNPDKRPSIKYVSDYLDRLA